MRDFSPSYIQSFGRFFEGEQRIVVGYGGKVARSDFVDCKLGFGQCLFDGWRDIVRR